MDRAREERARARGCRVEEELNASADAVWRVLADFGSVDQWGPDIQGCRVEGEGVGALRVLDMGDMSFRERIEVLDATSRTFGYAIVEGPMPVRDYHARVRVEASGPGRCRVSWSCRFEAPELGEEEIAGIEGSLAEAYRGMIAALSRVVVRG